MNSAVNRIREALGDTASNPRFVETLARRGYRFVAPVERIAFSEAPPPSESVASRASRPQVRLGQENGQPPEPESKLFDRILASPEELPKASHSSCADALRPVAVHVFGILCWGAGKSGGD